MSSDFDECQSPEYNDCYEQAFCFNLAGSFTCSCREGLVDSGVPSRPGRSCTGGFSTVLALPHATFRGVIYLTLRSTAIRLVLDSELIHESTLESKVFA